MRKGMHMRLVMLAVSIMIVGMLTPASANTVATSTMWFQGELTDVGGGVYTGVLNMVDEAAAGIGDGVSGYDIYAREGDTAWFGDDPGSGPVWTSQAIGSDHDAWPAWTVDTPDWYQYSVEFAIEGSDYTWALRNHAGSTEGAPHSTSAMGVPMSGLVDWNALIAAETDVGAYLPGTGTPEIPGGAAGKGGGAGYWDMDWSWGSEAVPLQWSNFSINMQQEGDLWTLSMTPVPEPSTVILLGLGLAGMAGVAHRRRKK